MKLVFFGPAPSAATTLYASAKLGELPDALALSVVANLASCSLDKPNGDTAMAGRWLSALHTLIQAGTLEHDKGKVSRPTLCAVLPVLEAEGLRAGSALRAWSGADTQADQRRQDGTKREAASKVTSATPEAVEWQAKTYPLERLLGGIKVLLEGGRTEFADLQGGEDGSLPFSIPMMLAAVEKFDEQLKIPRTDNETQGRWIKSLYPQFIFKTTSVPNKSYVQSLLNEAYAEGKLRHADGEINEDAASYIKRVA